MKKATICLQCDPQLNTLTDEDYPNSGDVELLKSQLTDGLNERLKLYAIVDAGVAKESFLEALDQTFKVPAVSLIPGDERYSLRNVGPVLFSLEGNLDFLDWILRKGWRRSWGVYIQSKADFSELYTHLFSLTCASIPDGRDVTFRYHDPRVLAPFLNVLSKEERETFMGPVYRIFHEQEDRIKPAVYVNLQSENDVERTYKTPKNWSVRPQPGWLINQKQWDAIQWVRYYKIARRVIDIISSEGSEINHDKVYQKNCIERAIFFGCINDKQFASYLLICFAFKKYYLLNFEKRFRCNSFNNEELLSYLVGIYFYLKGGEYE